MKLLTLLLLAALAGCTTAHIDNTSFDEAGLRSEHCVADYSSFSPWGHTDSTGIEGCGAKGRSKGADQSALLSVILKGISAGAP